MKTLQIVNLIFLLLLINISYGQDYIFDKTVKSNFSTGSFPNQENTNLFNSKDDSYHMQIYNWNDSIISRIFDIKRCKVHYFYIDKLDSLNYVKTLDRTKDVKDYTFEFSEIKEKKGTNEVTFKILNKQKRRIAKYKFNIRKTDQNLFSVFKLSALETLLFTEVRAPINFLVLKAKGRNTSGIFVTYKLKSIEDINLIVKIP